jgi:hypothetical protein
MSEEVGIRYVAEGTQEAAAAIDNVTSAVTRNDQATTVSKEQWKAWERAIQDATERGDGVAAMHQRLSQAQAENTQQGAQFVQRFAGMASAVASVAGALGGESETAGLIARLASGAAQAASMGAAFGPAGLLVGGLTAIVPLLASMSSGAEGAARSTSILTESQAHLTTAIGGSIAEIDEYIERVNELDAANQRARRIGEGLGSQDEQFAAANLAGARVGRLSAQVSDLRRREREASGSIESIADSDALEALTERRVALERELVDARAESQRLGQLALQVEREELEIQSDLITTRRDADIEEAAERARREEEREQREEHARTMAGHRQQEREDAEALRRIMRESDEAISFAAGVRDEAGRTRNGEDLGVDGPSAASLRSGQGGGGGVSAQMEQQRALARLEAANHDDRVRKQQIYVASIQDEINALTGAGEQLGGVFSNAFQAAIQGQADFGQAMQDGIRQVLLQYGTQMVAEGVGALLTGVGNAIFNPPAAAAKFAEGAGKVALGVGLGAAGAAIPASANGSGGRPAEAPRGPTGPAANGPPAPVVVNLNAPTIMGGTYAEVGRTLGRTAAEGARRYQRRIA